jgi:hypothetical protein
MNLVVGIVFMAVALGLFVPHWQRKHWAWLGLWVTLMVVLFYFKGH